MNPMFFSLPNPYQVAILKRIAHPNIIKLIEVLDDPKKDTLFLGTKNCIAPDLGKHSEGG